MENKSSRFLESVLIEIFLKSYIESVHEERKCGLIFSWTNVTWSWNKVNLKDFHPSLTFQKITILHQIVKSNIFSKKMFWSQFWKKCIALLQHLTQDISDFNPRRLGGPNFNPSEIFSTQYVQLQFDGMIARGDHLHHEDISGRNVVITKAKFK